MKPFRNPASLPGAIMSRHSSLLGLAAAILAALSAHGVEVIDLTAAARTAGSAAWEAYASSTNKIGRAHV